VAPQTLTHTGSMTGYQPVGDEVRADAGTPHASGPGSVSPSIGGQFAGVRPLGQPGRAGQDDQDERPEPPERDEAGNARRDAYSVTVEHQGPAYGGAAYTSGGQVADSISNAPERASVEPPAGKVIQGSIIPAAIEAADV
jgi:hypothetical protein